ncbi:SDR family oxidoreductase [Bordetella ansorpii]|uniref:SDR family oxidoreductase n=1 Tax=Bordetella ansorpii TaxID=288768 RepID=UPI0008268644|nr:SDR family oxidoreductase [Bordetella ansorpii]
MNILVCGANGFIGAALCRALAPHRIIKGVRQPRAADEIAIDYTVDLDAGAWMDSLQGVDVVINAVGIVNEHGAQTFDRVQREAPIALFDACVRAGVKRVIQISALGAQTGDARFLQTRRAADEHLQSLGIPHHLLRPALVYGTEGTSARYFRTLASMPVHLLPAGGHQVLRPVHIDELAEAVVRLLDGNHAEPSVLDVVGGTEVDYRQMLATYRASMGFAPAWRIGIPSRLMDLGAALLERVPGSLFTRETWRMLRAGNTADAAPMAAVLGRAPAGIETFIPRREAPALRQQALAAWRPALLRGALAITWLWTAVCSAFIYPQADSLALLAGVPLHGLPALVALYAACALDAAFGIATLLRPGRRLWAAQAALILGYSLVIAVALPEFLWHPFAPLLKNLPILALLILLFSEESES